MTTTIRDGATDLYRFFDADDRLLYVGISFSAVARASSHRAEKAWWPDVARMEVEHLPSRRTAEDAERRAIATERPLHNVMHNGTKSLTSTVPIDLAFTCGEVYAFGMSDGSCPVGLVTNHVKTDGITTGLEVKLYSWMTGLFGHEVRVINVGAWVQAVRAVSAKVDGDTVFDMDPLGSFQEFWTTPTAPKKPAPRKQPKGEAGDAVYHAVLKLMSASETPSPWAYQDIVAAIGEGVRDAVSDYLAANGISA